MSIFIKVEKFGTAPLLFRSREIATALGEDEYGILSCDNPICRFFTAYKTPTQILVFSNDDRLKQNNKAVANGKQTSLSSGDSLTLNDYKFIFFLSNNSAETLAHSTTSMASLITTERLLEKKYCPEISYSLAFIHNTYKLLPNVSLCVGASEDAAICLDFPEIAEKHVMLTYTCDKVSIIPLEKCVAINGINISKSVSVTENVTIQLTPSAVELKLNFFPKDATDIN